MKKNVFLISLKGGITFVIIISLMLVILFIVDNRLIATAIRDISNFMYFKFEDVNFEEIEHLFLKRYMRLHLVSFISTGILFIVLFFTTVRRLVIKRLKSLIDVVDEIAKTGNYKKRLDTNGNDEITKLKNGINYLLNSIERREALLNRTRNKLETRVEERTERLKIINSRLNEEIKLQRKLKNDLSESEEMYKSLIENAGQMILIVQDKNIVYYNREFSRVTGYEKNELIGKDYLTLVHHEDRKIVEEAYNKRVNGDFVRPYEIRLISKSGKIICGEVNAVRVTYKKRPASLGFITDITDRKRLEDERKKLHEQLIQSQKMEAIGRFAGGIVHDFNNLLTPIIGYTELLLMKNDGNNMYNDYLNEIRESAHKASELVKRLLALSRKQVLSVKTLNINDIVINLKKMLHRIIGEDIDFKIDLDPEVRCIQGDKGQIEQVILNLVVNSRDAMPDGGKLKIATLKKEIDEYYVRKNVQAKRGEAVCLIVEDSGYGMDEETKMHIFEPFFTTKEEGKGTGLGLSVVYGIVEQHGGWIEVESEIGKGTRFLVYFPVTDKIEGDSDDNINVNNKNINNMPVNGKGEKVLLVEDDDMVRKYVKKLLEKNGFVVIDTPSAREALEIITKEINWISHLITDIITPDMNGIELVKEVKRYKDDLKIIVISGYTDDRFDIDYIKKQGISFLQKPFSSRDLFKYMNFYNN